MRTTEHAEMLVLRLNALVLLAFKVTIVARMWMIVSWRIARTMQHVRMALMSTGVYVDQAFREHYARMM